MRKKAIDQLPPGLPETYQRIVAAISRSPDDLDLLRKAITWVIYSTRPLKMHELATAVVIQPGFEFTSDQQLDRHEEILEICGSFVKLNAQTNCVELSHISVAEYFTSPYLPDRTENTEYIKKEAGHRLLLECCLTYLSSPPFDSGPCRSVADAHERSRLSFLYYPLYNWPEHATKIKDEQDQALILRFFSHPSYRSWCQIFQVLELNETREREWVLWRVHQQRNVPALYYASMFGLDRVVTCLLTRGHEANGAEGHPLLAAVQYRHPSTLRLLLNAGADPNVVGAMYGDTALHIAGGTGNADVVEMLLSSGADIDTKNDQGLNALQVTLDRNHEVAPEISVVKLLMNPKNLKVRDMGGRSLLHMAAAKGFVDIASLFLDEGVAVDDLDNDGNTPLHLAAREGHESMVRLLFKWRANPKISNIHGSTAIQLAGEFKRGRILESMICLMFTAERPKPFLNNRWMMPRRLLKCYKMLAHLQPKESIWHQNLGADYLWLGDMIMASTSFHKALQCELANEMVASVASTLRLFQCSHHKDQYCWHDQYNVSPVQLVRGTRYNCQACSTPFMSFCFRCNPKQCPQHLLPLTTTSGSKWIELKSSAEHFGLDAKKESKDVVCCPILSRIKNCRSINRAFMEEAFKLKMS
jgi:Ankyrin repeats (3 copies)